MPNYDFKKDFIVASKTEEEIASILVTRGCTIIGFNNDNRYDIEFSINDSVFTVEIKEDFTCERTGNVGVEFSCRGKPSGISVSQADYYVYKLHRPGGIIESRIMLTSSLKEIIDSKKYHRVVNGGDPGSNSLNYLFYLKDFDAISIPLSKAVFKCE